MSKAILDHTDATTADELERPESTLVDPSRCPPCEILVNIGSILLDDRQYRSLSSLSAGSIYIEDALKLIGRRFTVIDGQEKELEALASDGRTVHIQHLLFSGTTNSQTQSASDWPTKQRAKENGKHALKGVGYWGPVAPIVNPDEESPAQDPVEAIQLYRCIDVLSNAVSGTALEILDLDQAADILLHVTDLDANFDRRTVQLNLLWSDPTIPVTPVQSPLPSMVLLGAHWVLNLNEKRSASEEAIAWAAGLARIVIGGLAINCQPFGKWAAPARQLPFHRPELVIVGVASLQVATAMLEMLSDVYKVRAGAVRVKVLIVVELPIASILPSVEETVDMLRILPPELAKGVSEQDLWDWKNHVCKPDIRVEIFVADGDGSVVTSSIGIEYPTIVQRNWHIGKKTKPDRVIVTRVHIERPNGDATDDSDDDEEGTERRVEPYISLR